MHHFSIETSPHFRLFDFFVACLVLKLLPWSSTTSFSFQVIRRFFVCCFFSLSLSECLVSLMMSFVFCMIIELDHLLHILILHSHILFLFVLISFRYTWFFVVVVILVVSACVWFHLLIIIIYAKVKKWKGTNTLQSAGIKHTCVRNWRTSVLSVS